MENIQKVRIEHVETCKGSYQGKRLAYKVLEYSYTLYIALQTG